MQQEVPDPVPEVTQKLRAADVVSVLRLHQWVKNVLIFAPLVLGGKAGDMLVWQRAALGFIAFGCLASGTYVLNDISDRDNDRRHRTKSRRPVASGVLPVNLAFVIAIVAIGGGLALGWQLGRAPFEVLAAYLIGTLAYSLWLKAHAMVDVVTIAGLFTLRLVFGTVAAGVPESPWLMVLSMSVFTSLALAKRLADLHRTSPLERKIAGRGYRPTDAHFVRGFGLASASVAVLILILYLIEEAFPRQVYSYPHFLWVSPVVLFLFFSRIWLKAERGQLHDDPTIFAIKDPACVLYMTLIGAAFIMATGVLDRFAF